MAKKVTNKIKLKLLEIEYVMVRCVCGRERGYGLGSGDVQGLAGISLEVTKWAGLVGRVEKV